MVVRTPLCHMPVLWLSCARASTGSAEHTRLLVCYRYACEVVADIAALLAAGLQGLRHSAVAKERAEAVYQRKLSICNEACLAPAWKTTRSSLMSSSLLKGWGSHG